MKPLSTVMQTTLLGSALVFFASCGADHADAPPLAGSAPAPEQRGWLQTTGDAAWDAVASPIGGLVPKPAPKSAKPELTPMDPPETVIITRENWGLTIEGAETAPATAPQPVATQAAEPKAGG
jgi:hypothetical protein